MLFLFRVQKQLRNRVQCMKAKALNLQFRKARLENGAHPVANVGSSHSERQATTSSKMKTRLQSLSYRGGSHKCKLVVERQIPKRQSHGPFENGEKQSGKLGQMDVQLSLSPQSRWREKREILKLFLASFSFLPPLRKGWMGDECSLKRKN